MKVLVTSLPDIKKISPGRLHHLLKYLSQKHEITVLSVNAWWLEEKEDDFLKESLENVKIHYLSESRLNPILQEIFIARSLKYLSKNLNISSFNVHLNFNSLIAGYVVTKKAKVPVVFDICDDIVNWITSSPQVPTLLKPIGGVAGSFMLRKNIQISKKITYSTELLRDSYALPKNKSILIPNGVDTNLFYKRGGKIKEQIGISDSEFVLGFVGFLGEWVDLKPIFEIIKVLKNQLKIKMVVVGDGGKLTEFKGLLKKYGIEDCLIFTGNVAYLEVPAYISCMNVCLLPFNTSTISQGAFPLKLLEYMACERPVISTPLAGVREVVEDRVLYAHNGEKLKQKILELYYNEDLRIELGRRGREFVKQNYGWDKICHKFENVLIQVAED